MPETDPKVTPTVRAPLLIGQKDRQYQRRSQFAYGLQFFNGLPVSVTISLRSGARFTLPPIPGSRPAKLVICASYDRQREVNFDARDLLDGHGDPLDDESKLLEDALVDLEPANRMSPMVPHSGAIKYALSKQELDRNGGQVYLHNLDIVVSIYKLENVSAHPGTLSAQKNKFLNDDPILSALKGFSFSIEIVDRAKRFGERYLNLQNIVYRIPITRDAGKNDGLYIRHSGESSGSEIGMEIPEAQYFSFEEAEKLPWLYRTHADAQTLGDPQAQAKRDLENRQYAFKQLEQDWKEQDGHRKAEQAEQQRELERERERVKREQQVREDLLAERETRLRILEADFNERKLLYSHLNDTRKYQQEVRLSKTKERQEVAKWVPLVLGLIGSGVALYQKLSK